MNAETVNVEMYLNPDFLEYQVTSLLGYEASVKLERLKLIAAYKKVKNFRGTVDSPLDILGEAIEKGQNLKARSLSVGDVIKLDDVFYVVEPRGYRRLSGSI